MKNTENPQPNSSPLPRKRINFQFDLFESFDEDDVLYHEIETVRASLNKLRRKVFAELADMQKELETMKEENLKLKYALLNEKEETEHERKLYEL